MSGRTRPPMRYGWLVVSSAASDMEAQHVTHTLLRHGVEPTIEMIGDLIDALRPDEADLRRMRTDRDLQPKVLDRDIYASISLDPDGDLVILDQGGETIVMPMADLGAFADAIERLYTGNPPPIEERIPPASTASAWRGEFEPGADWDLIPEHMRDALRRYVERHERVGDFLIAILSNDLSAAIARADGFNITRLPDYVHFLHNYAPAPCWGSPAKVKDWIRIGSNS